MASEIVFADLEKLLLKLGFTSQNQTSQKLFQYSPENVLIVLPAYSQDEQIHPVHLVAIRKTLLEHELITAAAFDGFLEKISG
jgi:hypothetical protein